MLPIVLIVALIVSVALHLGGRRRLAAVVATVAVKGILKGP